MWLLDSNILPALFDQQAPGHARAVATGRAVGWDRLAIPVIVAAEQLEGRLRYLEESHRRRSAQLLQAFSRFEETCRMLNAFRMIPLTEDALRIYNAGTLPGKMSRNDRLIAAIALAGNHVLVTRNVADFLPVRGLRIENWIDDPLP